MIERIKKAVIPVAGLGTRMLPATKAIPKELLPVYDRPIIEHVVQEAFAGGISEIIFVTRSGKEAIENHFDANFELEHRLDKKGDESTLGLVKNIVSGDVKITSVRQSDPSGLGHAVLCSKHLINNEPFAVLLPDMLILDSPKYERHFSFARLIQAWEETGQGQVMVEEVESAAVESYGIADLSESITEPFVSRGINRLVEKPTPSNAPSNLAILGRYVLPFSIFEALEKTVPGLAGEIQLTDALDVLARTAGLNALKTDAEVYDCGNKEGFLSANLAVGMRNLETKEAITKLFNERWGQHGD